VIGIGDGISGYATDELYTDAEEFFERGFSDAKIADPQGSRDECQGKQGGIAAMVLSFFDDVTLPPRSTWTIAYVLFETLAPEEGEEAHVVLRYADGCAHGQPVQNSVTQDRESVLPEKGSMEVRVLPAPPFLRGDSNADGRVDISDAIRIFMYLFLGADAPRCMDAADATDDGKLDLSDGVRILCDFFIPYTAIPPPGPFQCGHDPTMDWLYCESYSMCP